MINATLSSSVAMLPIGELLLGYWYWVAVVAVFAVVLVVVGCDILVCVLAMACVRTPTQSWVARVRDIGVGAWQQRWVQVYLPR